MTKEEARLRAIPIWEALSDSRRESLAAALLERIRSQRFARLFVTFPVGAELNMMGDLRGSGLPIYLPRIHDSGMSFLLFARGDEVQPTSPGRFGIPAPVSGEAAVPGEGDLCLLPSLACNSSGYRLGRGGGYFDRYFAANPTAKKCRKVSVLPVELTEIHFAEQLHDLKLDEVLTDTGTVIHHAGE